jgi:hypothetical protein
MSISNPLQGYEVKVLSGLYDGMCVIHAHYEGVEDMHSQSPINRRNDKMTATKKRTVELINEPGKMDSIINSFDDSKRMVDDSELIVSSVRAKETGVTDNFVSEDRFNTDDKGQTKTEEDVDDLSDNDNSSNDESSDESESERDEDDYVSPETLNDFIHDFYNFHPEKIRTLRGTGYIKKYVNTYYVITCNHIVIKYAKYKGYCFNTDHSVVDFDMEIYWRCPELDIAILKVSTSIPSTLSVLDVNDETFNTYYKSKKNTILTGEYIAKANRSDQSNTLQDRVVYGEVTIDNDMTLVFEPLVTRSLNDIPLINIPVDGIPIIKKFVKENKVDLKTELNTMNDRRRFISRSISERLSGLSGSLVRSDGKNVGMVCMFTDTSNGLFIKAVPFSMINVIIDNVLAGTLRRLMGIHVETHTAHIDYDTEDIHGHYITRQSCPYRNGRRWVKFAEGDMIFEVDNKSFNENHMLWSEHLGVFVPLNTYLMIVSNAYPSSQITIKVAKCYGDNIRTKVYNLKCKPYDDMFKIRISERYIIWNNIVFMELSEMMMIFYARLGIQIIDSTKSLDEYSNGKERVVIMFNYDKPLLDTSSLEAFRTSYISMPETGTNYSRYFYSVHMVGQKHINNLNDLNDTILNLTQRKQKNVSIKIINGTGETKIHKMNLR